MTFKNSYLSQDSVSIYKLEYIDNKSSFTLQQSGIKCFLIQSEGLSEDGLQIISNQYKLTSHDTFDVKEGFYIIPDSGKYVGQRFNIKNVLYKDGKKIHYTQLILEKK